MKPILYLLIGIFFGYEAIGQAFITTWKTDNPGLSANNQITIPTTGTGYSYSIYWEQVGNNSINGTLPGPITGTITITFPTSSIYRVHISGTFPRIYFNGVDSNSDYEKILTVDQWGSIGWESMNKAFAGCKNLTMPATDAPDLTRVTDMSEMFSSATNFNQSINHWDVGHVTNMSFLFRNATNFNQPMSGWNVLSVINMSGMFYGASSFNRPIDAWDVSNVTDMASMFSGASNFNQPIGNWNIGRVTNMNSMFADAFNFNMPLGDWDVKNVADMSLMFSSSGNNRHRFNQAIGNWNTESVTDMRGMFSNATNFNQPIGNWDVSNVTNMGGMFNIAESFNQPIGTWNTNKVKDMQGMFAGARSFNQPIEGWDVSQVTSMLYMFNFAISFNQPLGNWNVSNVKDMLGMFNFAISFNQPLVNWNVINVERMVLMFADASSFNQSLKNWDISNATNMGAMLNNTALSINNYDETLISWAAQNVKPNVPLGAIGLKYCQGAFARTQLQSKGWNIYGDVSLVPSTPVLVIQQPVCQGTAGTITATVQNPTDTYSFDGGTTFQASNIKTLLSPGAYSVIIKNDLGCTSASQQAIINNPFEKSPMPFVSGSPVVCPNVLGVDYSASNMAYTYQWFANGGTVQFQQNNQVKINWGPSKFDASIKALGFDEHNCPTDTAVFPVKIQIKLKPNLPAGFDSVCYNFRAGVPYQTTHTNGSVYTWFTNGGTFAEGQSTSKVKVDWTNLGDYQVWVKEENTTSTDYCEGFSDTLNVTVFKDLAAITMNFVSVDYDNDKNVQLRWEISLLERVADLVIISRRVAGSIAPWEVVATLQKNVQSFLDQNLATKSNVYEYKVEGFNKCDEGLQTVIHNTIQLIGDKVEEEELIELDWNNYNGWDEVEHYEVWRKLDDQSAYELIDVTPGDLTSYSGKYGADGFVHHLRIKAKKKGENTISWSNEIKLDFENPIDFVPNVITPNDDSNNDFFVIPKLHLYPDNAISIFDRWGQLVYNKNGYDNTWSAAGLSEGTYFYSLNINATQKNIKGWIQVIR